MFTVTLADPEAGILDDLVDLDRYPIDRTGSTAWNQQVAGIAAGLERDGAVQLPGFVRPTAIVSLQRELSLLRPYARVTTDRRSAYSRDTHLPASDPRAMESTWTAGHITRDMIPPHSPAQRLYVAPGFKHFIAGCLQRQRIFEYADPLAGLIATVLPPGGTYGWHYDTTEFVITLSVAVADRGGDFEYVHNLRRRGNENLEGLRSVLEGDVAKVRSLTSRPGDLQLFLGRYSLHRVTEVTGDSDRLTLVLAYADRPGVIGPADRTRRVYGRVTEAHLVGPLHHTGEDGLIL